MYDVFTCWNCLMQFQHVPTAYMTEKISIRLLKLTLIKYNPHCICPFQHVKLQINVKLPVTIWKIVYIYVTVLASNLISGTAILLIWYLHSCITTTFLTRTHKLKLNTQAQTEDSDLLDSPTMCVYKRYLHICDSNRNLVLWPKWLRYAVTSRNRIHNDPKAGNVTWPKITDQQSLYKCNTNRPTCTTRLLIGTHNACFRSFDNRWTHVQSRMTLKSSKSRHSLLIDIKPNEIWASSREKNVIVCAFVIVFN